MWGDAESSFAKNSKTSSPSKKVRLGAQSMHLAFTLAQICHHNLQQSGVGTQHSFYTKK